MRSFRTFAALAAAVFLMSAGAPAIAGTNYKSLGIGSETRTPHPGYPLKLVFATKTGALLADVQVRILNAKGKRVLSDAAAGPWVFAKLPAGRYSVVAHCLDGAATSARIQVPKKGQRTVILSFPAERVG